MAIGDAYATAATYRALFGLNDATGDAAILDDLTAVSRYLDIKLGRFFTRDAAAVARTYLPEVLTDTLYVDDIASTTNFDIKVDLTGDGSFSGEPSFATTDYQLLPRNAALGPEPKPWNAIYIPRWSAQSKFQAGQLVQVTSIGGWPAVPKALERGTCHLTGIWRLDSSRATARIPESMDESFTMSNDAQKILANLINAYGRHVVFG